ncbi:M64 family metallopeptidase [Prosthecobacter sp.]|uniref:M64 family metallopeptidase n=1 Tax=Prosthecobacter sp. TaxID=1965333 RepID=UPI002AB8BF3B|nr:M64 family metallopeptidase [Prosthecobacter sp.]MDZ4404093.1 M64 family metallopeptidase [Prosthecobacter sp.]
MMQRLLLLLLMTVSLHAQTSTLFTVQNNGPRSERINLVFLSEGYTTADMPNFATHVTNAVNVLFTKEPWAQYRSYCNVYRIEIASNESGCDNGNTSGANGTRDTYFNAGFNTPSVTQLLTLGSGGSTKAFNLLNTHVPEYDVPVVIVNDTKYGGAGGGISVASVNGSSAAVVEHEIGHSFANLADEYDTEYLIYTPAERSNNTAQTTRELIRWNHWIEASTPIPTAEITANNDLAGLFEGSMYRTSGWYRPHNNSLMKNLNRPCGQINREQFVLKFYNLVSTYDGYTPVSTSSTVITPSPLGFSVTPKVPTSGPTLTVTWKIDGVTQAGQTEAGFNTLSDFIGNGSHTVSATLSDPTTFVRLDPTNLLKDTITWNLTLSGQIPASLSNWRTTYGSDTTVLTPDSLPNLVKYALGLAANVTATPSQLPAGSMTSSTGQDYLTLTILRRMRRSDATYTVQVSNDLITWNSGAGHTVIVEDSDTQLVVRDAVSFSGSAQRFIRLAVQAVP